MSTGSKIAFVGLGAIGTPMARHLADSASLSVWNRTQATAAKFAAETGAREAVSPADAAADSEFLITCLPTSAEVESVLFGAEGAPDSAAAKLSPGTMVIDCTSGDPATSRRIASRLSERRIDFIDAPVSGGVVGAEQGKLTVMAGGDASSLERARPVLECFASKIVHCGGVGTGDAVKAINNALLAIHIWSTAEGLAALAKLGVDPGVALDVINASSGRSNSSINLFPQRVINRSFPRTFRLALLDKDARIAASIAAEAGTPSDILALTSRLFAEAHAELGDQADHVEAVKVVEKRAGVIIKGETR